MPKVDDVYQSNSQWLAHADLKGHEIPVTISGCTLEEVGQDKKMVVHFEKKEKALVLNKTNAGRIASAYGNDSDDWIGKELVLYPDTTEYQGNTVPCIRVRVPAKVALDDEIPF